MPPWFETVLLYLMFAAAGVFISYVACTTTARRLRGEIRRANDLQRVAESELMHMEASRDDWKRLATEVMVHNRELRRARQRSPWSVN